MVDARNGQLLDVVAGRTADAPARWLEARDPAWRARIQWAVMDLSGPYRATFDTMLPHAVQVADPFHVVKLAGAKPVECRRRVQNETLGHRGHKHDPLYRYRRLLLAAEERLDRKGDDKLQGLLHAGNPKGEVAYAWHARKPSGSSTTSPTPDLAARYLHELAKDLQDAEFPHEVRQLGRTPEAVAHPDRGLAPVPGHERTRRSGQQPRQEGQAGRVRLPGSSATTGSARSSTPAAPTGTYSQASLPAEIRSAANLEHPEHPVRRPHRSRRP